ncbi:EpsG family protein [Weissella viridescens]|uniref:EpsG family protein n=1 Tax=Weissella viridescens TaxID=1629 RepID=UPI004056B367
MPLVFYLAVIVEGIYGLIAPFKKTAFPILFVVLLGVMFAYVPVFVSDNAVYFWYYMHPDVPGKFEPLFNVLLRICSLSGLTYYQFKTVLFVMEMFFLYWGMRVFKLENKRLFMVFYTMIMFFESPIQLRNYLMATIVFVAVAYLWKGGRTSTLKFFGLLSIAMLIQSSAAFFLLFYLVFKIKKMKTEYIIIRVALVLMLAIVFPPTRAIYSQMVTLIANEIPVFGPKIAKYALRFQPGLIILMDIPITIILYVLFRYLHKRIEGTNYESLLSYVDLGRKMSLMFFFLIPFYLTAYNFDRILIDGFLVLFVSFIKLFTLLPSRNRWTIITIAFALFGSYSYATYHYGSKYHLTYEPVLNQNIRYPVKDFIQKESYTND